LKVEDRGNGGQKPHGLTAGQDAPNTTNAHLGLSRWSDDQSSFGRPRRYATTRFYPGGAM